jgi:hypothetical protein
MTDETISLSIVQCDPQQSYRLTTLGSCFMPY